MLDGLERLLLAYHRMDAARVDDAAVQEQPRACTDPGDGAFLQKLSQCTASKILITSRLFPSDLRDRSGQLRSGSRRLALADLSTEDAITLMEHIGVHGSHAFMQAMLGQFGNLALLVQVLAGRIRDYRPAPGQFDVWYEAEGQHLQLDPHDLNARQVSILEVSLKDLDPAIFQLLCWMAAFRFPLQYAALKAMNPFKEPLQGEIPLASPAHEASGSRLADEAGPIRLIRALSVLEERGLVQWDRKRNRYDLHPVVRFYAYSRLQDKPATWAQKRSYFEAMSAEDATEVNDVADLHPTLELYYTLVESAALDEAYALYRSRLDANLFYTLGAYGTIIELLLPLFPDGLSESPRLGSRADAVRAADDLAAALSALGDWTQAQALRGLIVRLTLQDGGAYDVIRALTGWCDTILSEGHRLATANRLYTLARDIAVAAKYQTVPDSVQWGLTRLYAITGAWRAGNAAYRALMSSTDESISYSCHSYVFAARLRFGQRKDTTALLNTAIAKARSSRYLRAEGDAETLRGEVALTRGNLTQAEEAWQASYSLAVQQGVPLGPYLANLARLRARQENARLARDLIAEALQGGGLHVALAAAEVYMALGDNTEAQHHIYSAYEQAWADGPPYQFALELARARRALKALKLPEPQLPRLDPARLSSVPYETEIRAYIWQL